MGEEEKKDKKKKDGKKKKSEGGKKKKAKKAETSFIKKGKGEGEGKGPKPAQGGDDHEHEGGDHDGPSDMEMMEHMMGGNPFSEDEMAEFEQLSHDDKCDMAAKTAMENHGEDGDKKKFMMAAFGVCTKC